MASQKPKIKKIKIIIRRRRRSTIQQTHTHTHKKKGGTMWKNTVHFGCWYIHRRGKADGTEATSKVTSFGAHWVNLPTLNTKSDLLEPESTSRKRPIHSVKPSKNSPWFFQQSSCFRFGFKLQSLLKSC